MTLDLDVTGDLTISGRDLTTENSGTVSGTSTTQTITLPEGLATYIVSTQMVGSNCEIVKTAIVSAVTSNVIADVTELNVVDFNLGDVAIRNYGTLASGAFSSDNGRKVDIIFDATGVSGTTSWTWSVKRLH